ncbi:MAG: hypothetical protein K8R23_10105 [Chthoniobacter sp.]|nr:hypothetical protein [Chthoniobacter sp.]
MNVMFGVSPQSVKLPVFCLVLVLSLQACHFRRGSGSGGNTSSEGHFCVAAAKTDRGLYAIDYAIDGETLLFAVITEPAGPEATKTHGSLRFVGDSHSGLSGYGVQKPDGSGILPLTYQLYQVTPYGVLFTDARVSAPVFQAFLASERSDLSIASLLAYAARQAPKKP